jgi:hypothetical protein
MSNGYSNSLREVIEPELGCTGHPAKVCWLVAHHITVTANLGYANVSFPY